MSDKRYKGLSTTVKDFNEGKGIVTFAFSKYGVIDSDNDMMKAGAFKKTVKENFSRIKHLKFHDTRQSPGKLLAIYDEGDYAVAESQLNLNTQCGRETFEEYKLGQITEHSHGFIAVKQAQDKTLGCNVITEVKLFETSSLLAWGANEFTPMLGAKQLQAVTSDLVKKLRADLSNITDEDFEQRLKEIMISLYTDAPDNGKRSFNVTIISEHSDDDQPEPKPTVIEPSGMDYDKMMKYFNL